MRAVVIAKPGGPDVLEIRDLERPVAGTEHVLVRVHAAGLNRADLLQREGRYPPPPGVRPDVPGLEYAGEVVELGDGVSLHAIGARIFGIVAGAAQADFVVAHERAVASIPDALDWTHAAAVPEVFITAHDALFVQARLRPSERVLIHAVGSGVGLAAVQLCRTLGAVPYGTARSVGKIEQARGHGLEDGIEIRGDLAALEPAALEWTQGRGFDVVLDLVGGPYVRASANALGHGGRLMLVGAVAGPHAELDLGKVLYKRLKIIGTVLRARPLEEKIEATRAFSREVVPLLASNMIAPVIDSVFSLDEVRAAHERLASNETFGKVVLRVA